jgi:hypothetical protein
MTTERKLLPSPGIKWDGWDVDDMRDYARANMAPLEAEIAKLQELLRNADNLQETGNGT